jgi:hypothetical protein
VIGPCCRQISLHQGRVSAPSWPATLLGVHLLAVIQHCCLVTHDLALLVKLGGMAGLGNNLVQGFRTLRNLNWVEFTF